VVAPGYIETAINRGVDTKLKADLDSGVDALVKAIDNEKRWAPVPAWPWVPIASALRHLPQSITRYLG